MLDYGDITICPEFEINLKVPEKEAKSWIEQQNRAIMGEIEETRKQYAKIFEIPVEQIDFFPLFPYANGLMHFSMSAYVFIDSKTKKALNLVEVASCEITV